MSYWNQSVWFGASTLWSSEFVLGHSQSKTFLKPACSTDMTSVNIHFTVIVEITFQCFLNNSTSNSHRCQNETDFSAFSISSKEYFAWSTCDNTEIRTFSRSSTDTAFVWKRFWLDIMQYWTRCCGRWCSHCKWSRSLVEVVVDLKKKRTAMTFP